jgi:predicted phage-related endonuclease
MFSPPETKVGLTTEPKPSHGSPEWLAARHRDHLGRARLTASIAGVLFASHPFIRPADLAVQMLRDEPPDEKTTEAMERGQDLEPAGLGHFVRKTSKPVVQPSVMYVHGRWLANLDGDVVGEAPVEVKTNAREYFDGTLPTYWHWQGVALRWCRYGSSGSVYWVILDKGLRFHIHDQHVTRDDFDELVAAGEDWLGYIDIGMAPAGIDLEAEHVAALNRGAAGAVELPDEARDWAKTLKTARIAKKTAEALEKEARDWLAAHLAGADVGQLGGVDLITWKEQAGRQSFDKQAFQREYPDLWQKFTKRGESFRVMRVKGIDDDDAD